MAQTKRKRSTKHRGNAAGVVESRGRTGRPPTKEEKKRAARDIAREERLNKPPTWRSSTTRALIVAVLMFVLLIISEKGKIVPALALTVFAAAIYIPGGYYVERYLWKRRMAKRAVTAKR